MIFSKACEYGIRATVFVAKNSLDQRRVSLREISYEVGSPEAFTAKVLQQLVKAKIIRSVKGPLGGFETDILRLNRVRLQDIVLAIDGDFTDRCALGLHRCSQKHPCPVHDKFKHIKSDLQSMLENTSLFEMCTGLKNGLTCLKH